jgi:hypothetical protein
MRTIKWQPFWIFAGRESYDPNSGMSFSITMYVIDGSGQPAPLEIFLCKPQVYGVWHCLWNDKKHINKLKSQNVTGIVVVDKDVTEFGVLPMKDYYPFPDIFQLEPHYLTCDEKRDILLHIDQSVVPFASIDQENLFYEIFLQDHVICVDGLFELLEEIVSMDPLQKNTLTARWSRIIMKELVEDQMEEYEITE